MTSRYVTTHRLAALDAALSARDRSVLATLARLRLATGAQLMRLHYTNITRRQATASLSSLVRRGLLLRLPRIIGGARAGSVGYVYALDVAGYRLQASADDRRYQPRGLGLPFLAHSLAISELYVRLVEASRPGPLQLKSFSGEPTCWRSFAGPGGARAVLKPDAHLLTTQGRFEDAWFIEVDRGTESAAPLTRKCEAYRQYWQTGTEQTRHEVFPRVLWLVPDEHRRSRLIEIIGRQPAQSWPLFAVSRFDEAVARISRGAHV